MGLWGGGVGVEWKWSGGGGWEGRRGMTNSKIACSSDSRQRVEPAKPGQHRDNLIRAVTESAVCVTAVP